MCPACVTTAVIIVAGSGGGAAAFLRKKLTALRATGVNGSRAVAGISSQAKQEKNEIRRPGDDYKCSGTTESRIP